MSDYPKTYRHPVTEQERTATNKAQEVSLKFDGYRVVEEKEPAKESEKAEDNKPSSTSTPKPTPPKDTK